MRNIAKLIGFGVVIWTMIVLAPKVEQLIFPDTWIETVEKSNVDVGALFYTEEINTAQAQEEIMKAIKED